MINQHLLYPLFLFYGMAFFAMGVAITSRDTRFSHLEIARCLWLFSIFAYTHAMLEWYSLFLIHHLPEFSQSVSMTHSFIKLGLVFVSFSFLLLFGISVLGRVYQKKGLQIYLTLPVLVFLFFGVMVYRVHHSADFSFDVADLTMRHLIGFPGAVISGMGLMLYSRTVKHISMNGALNFSGAGFFLICYGFLAGLVPSGSTLPVLGGPIELYRGISALIILYFLMHALQVFDEERKIQIEERLSRFAHSEKLHALGKLAFGVAHEINNPLGNISLNTELLRADLHKIDGLPEDC